jgi:dihydroflavonol-4-reductase
MSSVKTVIVIGGTGFLGYHAVNELSARGWDVTALGLPSSSTASLLSHAGRVVLRDLAASSDADLMALLKGQDALVFAAGMDDRISPKKPAYPIFKEANVNGSLRVLRLGKSAGIQRAVVLGSYFAHFNRIWPELRLAERHPYIRSRVEQEVAVVSIPGLSVSVLELPYIFGGIPSPGWKSLWMPLVKYIRSTPVVLYMKGGSACITAKSVGQAVVGALEWGEAGKCYPIGGENLTWSELLTRLAAADSRQIRVLSLPSWLIKIGMYAIWLSYQFQGREGGLDPRYFASLQMAETFLDPRPSQEALGYQTGGLDQAFQETILSCRK